MPLYPIQIDGRDVCVFYSEDADDWMHDEEGDADPLGDAERWRPRHGGEFQV